MCVFVGVRARACVNASSNKHNTFKRGNDRFLHCPPSDQLEKLDSVVIVVVVGRPPLGVAEKRHMSRKITKLEAGIWPELIGRVRSAVEVKTK